jgi:HK97 family phage portal protein
MGYLENLRSFRDEEQRVIGGVPWRPWDNPYWRFDAGGPVHPTRQFYGVDDAMGLPALYSAIKLLSDNAASLPIRVYQNYRDNNGDWRHSRWMGPTLFDQPSQVGTPFDWIATCMVSLLLQGNAWGFITNRDDYEYPTGIEWIPPDDIYVEDDEQQPWNPLRARVFLYGRQIDNWQHELFHLKAVPIAGRIEGISPLRAFADTILTGKMTQKYGTDWFMGGGFPPGVFKNSEIEIDKAQADEVRDQLVRTQRRREPLVVGRDWDYKPITVPPNEAQFIEAMQLSATQIAAVYNVPAARVGGLPAGGLHYSSQSQDALQIIEALRPWLKRMEYAFFNCLPKKRFTKFYTDALLDTDPKTRMEMYVQERQIGVRTADEIRELMDLPPLPKKIGEEALPLALMQEMAARAGVIPKSILSSVEFEMDIAATRLEQYAKEHPNLMQPKPPQVQDAGSYYASLVSATNRGSTEAEVQLRRISERAVILDKHPEYVGPWIPQDPLVASRQQSKVKDLVLDRIG